MVVGRSSRNCFMVGCWVFCIEVGVWGSEM